jgi:hypothetical protein
MGVLSEGWCEDAMIRFQKARGKLTLIDVRNVISTN